MIYWQTFFFGRLCFFGGLGLGCFPLILAGDLVVRKQIVVTEYDGTPPHWLDPAGNEISVGAEINSEG